MKYLLLKLAEEAGEVVVEAVKHRLHNNALTRRNLEMEVGDLLAIIDLLTAAGWLERKTIEQQRTARFRREYKRMETR